MRDSTHLWRGRSRRSPAPHRPGGGGGPPPEQGRQRGDHGDAGGRDGADAKQALPPDLGGSHGPMRPASGGLSPAGLRNTPLDWPPAIPPGMAFDSHERSTPMTRHYELVLMIDPEADDEARESLAGEVKSAIEQAGTLDKADNWGVRKMAYEIKQRNEADYRYFRFQGENELLNAPRPQPEDRRRRPALPHLPRRARRAHGRPARLRPPRPGGRRPPGPQRARPAPRPRRLTAPGAIGAFVRHSRTKAPNLGLTSVSSLQEALPGPAVCGDCSLRGEKRWPWRLVDSAPETQSVRSDQLGGDEHQLGSGHGQPDPRSGAPLPSQRNLRLQASRRGQQPPQGRQPPASGSTSPTTSTSPSGARRARTARTTSPRAGPWPSRGASTGASGRPRRARSARPSRSSPTASSSSARARATRASGQGNGNGFDPPSDVPADKSDFEEAGVASGSSSGGGGDDDIPF